MASTNAVRFCIALVFTLASSSVFPETLPETLQETLPQQITKYCGECRGKLRESTGAFILEAGEDALIARGWLAQNASKTIDVQYFIWSTDNVGILASEALLSAAERGVKVRVIVDDLLVDAEEGSLFALEAHPNVEIKIYNPKHSVGVSKAERAANLIVDYRGSNQRMHDKVAVFDGIAGITGGRNMADEYFDFNQEYNFRDRDILLLGKAVNDMSANFQEFWDSELAVPLAGLLNVTEGDFHSELVQQHYVNLHAYANNKENFDPAIRQAMNNLPAVFPELVDDVVWTDVEFISDVPGKNANKYLLGGGGEATQKLYSALKSAKKSVLIQSPYLVVPDEGLALMKTLISNGVSIRISTNSLVSTDNLMAFSGYHRQRRDLLKAGIKIYEFKDHPAIGKALMKRYPEVKDKNPIFAIHAKSMVIDNELIYIGSFNLDPRSANLNTEVGALINNKALARELSKSIQADMRGVNSWRITEKRNPDGYASLEKRVKLKAFKKLPLDEVL